MQFASRALNRAALRMRDKVSKLNLRVTFIEGADEQALTGWHVAIKATWTD
jgi:hypothetical protein